MATIHAYREADNDHGQLDIFLKNGPAQTGVMAGVVAMAGQAAVQLGAARPAPELVAVAFALLLAVYHVRMVQRLELPNCAVLVPIVTLVLFVTGWGANGLVSETRHRGQEDERAALVSTLTAEKTNLSQQIQSQQRELDILRRLAGLPASEPSSPRPSPGPRSELPDTSRPIVGLLEKFSRWLRPVAHAQTSIAESTPTSPPPAERARLLRKLQAQQEQQRLLREDAEHLRRLREKAEQRTREERQRPDSLWKKW